MVFMIPIATMLGVARAGPVDIQVQAIALESGTVEIESPSEGLPKMYVANGTDSFYCTVGGTKGQYRRVAEKLAVFLQTVAAEAPGHPEAVWNDGAGVAIMGTVPMTMCDLRASTKEGHLFITVTHTRACFGSAGCNYESVTVRSTPEQALNWANSLRASAP